MEGEICKNNHDKKRKGKRELRNLEWDMNGNGIVDG